MFPCKPIFGRMMTVWVDVGCAPWDVHLGERAGVESIRFGIDQGAEGLKHFQEDLVVVGLALCHDRLDHFRDGPRGERVVREKALETPQSDCRQVRCLALARQEQRWEELVAFPHCQDSDQTST